MSAKMFKDWLNSVCSAVRAWDGAEMEMYSCQEKFNHDTVVTLNFRPSGELPEEDWNSHFYPFIGWLATNAKIIGWNALPLEEADGWKVVGFIKKGL